MEQGDGAIRDALAYQERAREIADQSGVQSQSPDIARAAVIGAGTMGTGIALALSRAGIRTLLIDKDTAALARAKARIESDTCNAIGKGRIGAAEGEMAMECMSYSDAIETIGPVDLAIEAAFEQLSVKRAIMVELDRHCPPSAILGTNTSTLDLDAIAHATSRPHRVIGLHFFSPAHIMPLIEIVRGAKTDDAIIEAAIGLSRRLNKAGIVVGNCYGFAGNRMVEGMGREVNRLLLEGNAPVDIDAAIRAFGMAMGPLEVADLVGIDIPFQARQENSQALISDNAYYRMADKLVELGRLGQKTGRGYYQYEKGIRGGQVDPEVGEIAASEAARLGVEQKLSTAEEIVERCILPLINEGARILEEGIASRASDLDLIYTLGYGFPAERGGPMYYADRLGMDHVRNRLNALRAQYGDYWVTAPLIERLADEHSSFAEYDRQNGPREDAAKNQEGLGV